MIKALLLPIILAALTAPALAAPTTLAVDPAQMPDGTYTATVERVVDSKHVLVKMDNGNEMTLSTTRASVDFSKAHPNDHIKLSLIKGIVAVYAIQ